MIRSKTIIITSTAFFAVISISWLAWSKEASETISSNYEENRSVEILDRNGKLAFTEKNPLGFYAIYTNSLPQALMDGLIKKEDRFFRYHPGINPVSLSREISFRLRDKRTAGSTIDQQLAKILLGYGDKTTASAKFKEMSYALALETWTDKDEVLLMYANSIYFGNGVQGIETASRLYFGKPAATLSNEEIASLLASIPSPSTLNPFESANREAAEKAATLADLPYSAESYPAISEEERRMDFRRFTQNQESFELSSLNTTPTPQITHITPISPAKQIKSSIDLALTGKLRQIAKRYTEKNFRKNGTNAAIVVILPETNELLALVGSPDPSIDDYGYRINMAVKPRPIGSTVKPFIYLKAFEKGARPYTLVEDKEYKYGVKGGFAFYPKNYDFEYRGTVDLEYALANSLNVPTVKALEYYGTDNFYSFLEKDLGLKPVQDLKNYELGIALGGLEMDLLSLCYYYSIFPNGGILRPLDTGNGMKVDRESISADISRYKPISDKKYVELINKTLSNRTIGIEEFGQKGSLNLPHDNYAVKTGTSRDYHDSWTIGYTPDFLVGVWLGNAENKPMDEVSGSMGAGQIWREAMNLLYASEYDRGTPFDFNDIETFEDGPSIEYGLADDNFEASKRIMTENPLIKNPHDGDTFLYEKEMEINLISSADTIWTANGTVIGVGTSVSWQPEKPGKYRLEADAGELKEAIDIRIAE